MTKLQTSVFILSIVVYVVIVGLFSNESSQLDARIAIFIGMIIGFAICKVWTKDKK